MSKISSYSTVPSSGYASASLVVDGDSGTHRVALSELFDFMNTPQHEDSEYYESMNNAIAHRRYRGKKLGTQITAAQYQAITSGTFDDIYVGDYWEITAPSALGSYVYWATVADVDYFYAQHSVWPQVWTGMDQTIYNTHHIVLVFYVQLTGKAFFGGEYVAYGHKASGYNGFQGDKFYTASSTTANEYGKVMHNRVIGSSFRLHPYPQRAGQRVNTGMWNELASGTLLVEDGVSGAYAHGTLEVYAGQSYQVIGEVDLYGSVRSGHTCGANYGGYANSMNNPRAFALFDQAPWSYKSSDGTGTNFYLRDLSNTASAGAVAPNRSSHVCVLMNNGGLYVHGGTEAHNWAVYTVVG